MVGLTVEQQDRLIRRDWPFRTVLLGGGLGLWRGSLLGLSAKYDVSILYVTKPFRDGFELGHSWFPEVRIMAPAICRRAEAPDEPIPHVYREGLVARPMLCLFDPVENGWSQELSIAATTIPLTADWLRFYEAWTATGVWTGGGRDHVGSVVPAENGIEPAATNDCRVTRLAGLAASRATLACTTTVNPQGIPRWQFLDLLSLPRSAEGPRQAPVPARADLALAA